jgi:hypothetical protein
MNRIDCEGLTRWQAKLGMLEIEVDDLRKRVHLGSFEVAYKLSQTILELSIYKLDQHDQFRHTRFMKAYKQ